MIQTHGLFAAESVFSTWGFGRSQLTPPHFACTRLINDRGYCFVSNCVSKPCSSFECGLGFAL